MRPHPGLPARTLATGSLGLVLALSVAGCSSSAPRQAQSEPAASASASATRPAAPSPSPSRTTSPTPSPSAPVTTTSAAVVEKYVDQVPADVRKEYFTQGSVPPSYADWISLTPQQTTSAGQVEVKVDRRLPACGKENAPHYPSDQHAAGFASRLFQDGGYIVARQLTVYHGADEAKAAVQEVVDAKDTCSVYDGKQVTGAEYGDLVDAGELDVPQHDGTVAGETSLAAGGAGVSWWTVVSRQGNAVVLTRVVDPKADVSADGLPNDSIGFRKEVLAQADTSSKALDALAG